MSPAPPSGESAAEAATRLQRSRLLEELTRRIVHAVNNSLAAIRSQAELVQLEAGGAIHEDMRTVIGSVDAGAAHLNRLADLLREPEDCGGSANLARTLDEGFLSFCRAALGAGIPLRAVGPVANVWLGVSGTDIRLLVLDLLLHACGDGDSGSGLRLDCGLEGDRPDAQAGLAVSPLRTAGRELPALARTIAEEANGSLRIEEGREGGPTVVARLPILAREEGRSA